MTDDLDRETLRTVLRMMAHDLRNPLSALQSNISFIGSMAHDRDPDVADALSDSIVSCESLAHIIDNLEAFAASFGTQRPEPRLSLQLTQIVEAVVEHNQSTARSHGVSLRLTQRQPAARVTAHREMLGRAIENLVRNAIQYCPDGHSIKVTIRSEAREHVVRVEDPGPPVPPELAERAFSVAGQIDAKALSSGRYSRGLGLFAARVQASMTGAHVACASSEIGNALELRIPHAGQAA